MTTVLLYFTVVLIWGSTWLAVRYQLGVVAPEISVAYRIGTAALLMLFWSLARRLPLRFNRTDHLFMALQGALIFSTNFFLFYLAAGYLTTGLIAVIFSTASLMTITLNSLLTWRPPSPRFWLGALLGGIGISFIFSHELIELRLHSATMKGLLLSLGGTLCFSLGSIVSARNRVAGLSPCGNSAWAMLYGTVLLCIFAALSGKQFNFDFAPHYIISLTYLSLVGSVVAFAAYFALLSRIKAEQAAYSTVLFPLVALTLSTFFEGFRWTQPALFGVFLILGGNLMVLGSPLKKTRPAP
jgi:drug/metabolite transporter (DMT)-like permease